ncbi:hypothetical protein F5Y18DRAFT_403126 [Xylariaceae sp. FL1019]|nr:hypothetical protein F5Y18DRAFT_403126 [Xylariaceae sp. FL1019]
MMMLAFLPLFCDICVYPGYSLQLTAFSFSLELLLLSSAMEIEYLQIAISRAASWLVVGALVMARWENVDDPWAIVNTLSKVIVPISRLLITHQRNDGSADLAFVSQSAILIPASKRDIVGKTGLFFCVEGLHSVDATRH